MMRGSSEMQEQQALRQRGLWGVRETTSRSTTPRSMTPRSNRPYDPQVADSTTPRSKAAALDATPGSVRSHSRGPELRIALDATPVPGNVRGDSHRPEVRIFDSDIVAEKP